MNILGNCKILKGNYGYQTTISHKNQDGNWDNMYVDIQLPKGTELADKTEIEITKGFISMYKTKNGLTKIKFIIQEFKNPIEKEIVENLENYNSGDLPF